jgi:hypothetical protein
LAGLDDRQEEGLSRRRTLDSGAGRAYIVRRSMEIARPND